MITPRTVSLFLSLLTVLANAAVLTLVGLGLLARVSPFARATLARLRGAVRPSVPALAWLVAITATLGSLYFSEVAHFVPCRLCWYQRIGMYPLAVILAVAALRQDAGVWRYVVPLAVVAMPISAYHYALEWFPSLDAGACDPSAPCTLVWFRELGFVTLPFMALSAFALIVTLLLLGRDASPSEIAVPLPGASGTTDKETR